MVATTDLATSASLAEVLSARARRTPTSRLVIDAVGGVALSGAALWARPFGWFVLLTAGACLASYGLWALAENRLESPRPLDDRAALGLELSQRVATVLGLASFVATLFGALAIAFGPVIS